MARRRQTAGVAEPTVAPSATGAAPTVGAGAMVGALGGIPVGSSGPLAKEARAEGSDHRVSAHVREARVVYGPAVRPMPTVIRSSADLVAFLTTEIGNSAVERFAVVSIDSRGRPLAWGVVAIGTISHCPVSVAEILRFVLLSGGETFIVSHNHPSGDPSPSQDDVALTRRLADAARTCGLRLLDHVIVADPSWGVPTGAPYVSFVDTGLLIQG